MLELLPKKLGSDTLYHWVEAILRSSPMFI